MSSDPATPADPMVDASLLAGLNEAQAQAVSALLGPLLVVAGPGSGKTRVLTHRAAALVRSNVAAPEEVLAVTFTNKAAGEMRERLVGLLGEAAVSRMWVSTFHSLCARLLRVHHEQVGLPRAFSIVDSSDARTVLKSVATYLGVPDDAASLRGYASAISRAKNGAPVRPDQRTAAVAQAYAHELARLGAVDFDDLLLRTKALLTDRADVLERYRARFRFLLVDEYQDTNPVQYDIVRLLAFPRRNLCVVGDADQAIYGFRAATPEALVGFTTDFPDARVVVLEENYRSSAAILEVCQSVIDPSPSPFRPRLFTTRATGEKVRLLVADDDREEASAVSAELTSLPAGASAAVLVRMNAQTRVFEESLLASGIAYSVVGALRFYDRAEVKDALAYLRFIANPSDELALERALSAPRRGLGRKAVEELSSVASAAGVSLLEAMGCARRLGVPPARSEKWERFHEVLVDVRLAADTGPAAALARVLDLGARAHVASLGREGLTDRVANVEELVSAAESFVSRPDATDPEGRVPAELSGWEQTIAFLGNVALVSSADDSEPGSARVSILTAHSSKGKEFDWVYVAGLEEGLFPHSRADDRSGLDEERRLLFVACSRARSRLTLSRARRRLVFGKVVESDPSRFIASLPQSVVTKPLSSFSPHRSKPSTTDLPRYSRSVGSAAPQVLRPVGPRLDPALAHVGAKVVHGTFGRGVVEATEGAGDRLSVAVRFADGSRWLRLSLAPLELES